MVGMGEMWSHMGSIMATLMFVNAIIQQYFPYQIRGHVDKYTNKLRGLIYPYVQITFQEYTGDRFRRSEVYDAIQNYLSVKSSSRAKRLKASDIKDNKSVVLSPDDNEEVTDEFDGATLWWTSYKSSSKGMTMSVYPNTDEKRFYRLTFHRRHKDKVMSSYLGHVIGQGKGFEVKNRQRKLYTNGSSDNWWSDKRTKWSHVMFEHPATFETLALEPAMKKKILGDLVKFREGKEFYKRVGKPWKRGYLLYGPPGTGKSTMISAMANFLDYDVYDLELTAVKDNTELKKLLIDSSNKSIIVIEDIDCSLDLTGQRKKDKKKKKSKEEEKKDPMKKNMEEDANKSKVTLSGLLNFIDGIWSACGGERVIVFTTNHVDKLDPALIRRGRMDLHIELTYCRFDAFRVLARNYLSIPLGDSHERFPEIERLLTETDMTPADVAENLMAKCDEDDVDACLRNLVEALEQEKVDAKKRVEEEARLKAEEEEEDKKEKEEAKEKEEKEKKEKDEKVCTKCKEKLDNGVKENGTS